MKKLISLSICLLFIAACKKATTTSTPTTTTPTSTADTTPPVITLKGKQNDTISVQSTYTDAGATAMDDKDGDISVYIVKTGTVNTSLTGTYTIDYNARDAAGNNAVKKTRTMLVKNDADYLAGNYSAVSTSTLVNPGVGSSTISNNSFNTTATVSIYSNNQITLSTSHLFSSIKTNLTINAKSISFSGSNYSFTIGGSAPYNITGTISASGKSFTLTSDENNADYPNQIRYSNCVYTKL